MANETFPYVVPEYLLFVYMSTPFQLAFKDRMSGIIGGISKKLVLEIPVPLPPVTEQKRIVKKVNELVGLCDGLEEVNQIKLTNANAARSSAIQQLIAAAGDSDRAWRRLSSNWDSFLNQPEAAREFGQLVLSLAVRGQLVPQDPSDNPAAVELEQLHELGAARPVLFKLDPIRTSDHFRMAGHFAGSSRWLTRLEVSRTGSSSSRSESQEASPVLQH